MPGYTRPGALRPGFVPGFDVARGVISKAWMAGTSPAMLG
jgi:hypothetical protein